MLAGSVAMSTMIMAVFTFFDESLYMSISGVLFAALYIPWLLEASGVPTALPFVYILVSTRQHAVVSAISFAALFFGLVLFWYCRGSLRGAAAADIVLALASLLVGLGFTVQSWAPTSACVGWRSQIPAHAAWHLFSAIAMNRSGHIVEALVCYSDSLVSAGGAQHSKYN